MTDSENPCPCSRAMCSDVRPRRLVLPHGYRAGSVPGDSAAADHRREHEAIEIAAAYGDKRQRGNRKHRRAGHAARITGPAGLRTRRISWRLLPSASSAGSVSVEERAGRAKRES
jgi:hypothetical protein